MNHWDGDSGASEIKNLFKIILTLSGTFLKAMRAAAK